MKNENIWLIIILILLAFFLFGGFGFWMMPGGYGMMGMMGSCFGGGFTFMWIFMWLIWVLVIIALVLGIIWLIKQIQKK